MVRRKAHNLENGGSTPLPARKNLLIEILNILIQYIWMKTNIFLNAYQQPENKLTYNFLSVLEYLNDKKIVKFLTGLDADNPRPIKNIQTVYGGGETNPDGSFDIEVKGKKFTILYENKTNRRGLEPEQLIGHLKYRTDDALLLVTTPRLTDKEIVDDIGDKRILFKTWSEFANFLKDNYKDDFIITNFIDYGKQSGEFESLSELTKENIETACSFQKLNYDEKMRKIFEAFVEYFNIEKDRIFKKIIFRKYTNQWGRRGTEFGSQDENTYGQFGALAYYFDTFDHLIDFKQDGIPEISFFFDVNENKKTLLQQDGKFREIVNNLVNLGFESNLDNELTENTWRLLVYRRSINSFERLIPQTLSLFANEVFEKLISARANEHPYFKELM